MHTAKQNRLSDKSLETLLLLKASDRGRCCKLTTYTCDGDEVVVADFDDVVARQ